jgi:hypothetical protein
VSLYRGRSPRLRRARIFRIYKNLKKKGEQKLGATKKTSLGEENGGRLRKKKMK